MSEAAKTPLHDILSSIPEDARMIYEHSATHSQFIPVGRLAREARDELSALRTQNGGQAERILWLEEKLATVCERCESTVIQSERTENQQLRAALVRAREKITAIEVDSEEVLDFDECTAMLLSIDSYHDLTEVGEAIDDFLSGQPIEDKEQPCNPHPDSPHGFDRTASHNLGRYVCECEGWTPEDPRDKSDCHGPDWTERDKEYLK